MKKLLALLCIVPFLFLVSCPEDNGDKTVSVTGVTLDKSSLTLTVGMPAQRLIATVSPPGAANRSVTWSSSNEETATVTNAGYVKAESAGTATITVKTEDGGFIAECIVTCEDQSIGPKDGLSGKTAMEYVTSKRVYLGWNLGNSLDAPTEGSWTPMVTQELIIGVREAGFNLIRIPVTWSNNYRPMGPAPDYLLNQDRLERVAEVVDMAYEAGLVTVINIHHDTSWLSLNTAYGSPEGRARVMAQFTKVWEQIAERFKNYGDWLIFEPFNELQHTGGNSGWGTIQAEVFDIINDLNQVFVNTVRAAGGKNPQRYLIAQPYYARHFLAVDETFILPTDSTPNKQMASFHYYDPENFALQWQADPLKRADWGTEVDKDAMVNGSGRIPGFVEFKAKYTDKKIPVIMGECGATQYRGADINDEIEAINHASRVEYFGFLCEQAKAHGIIPVIWDNGSFTGTGEKFGLFDRYTGEPGTEKEAEIIRAMVNAVK